MEFEGINRNADGLFLLKDIEKQIDDAIDEYDLLQRTILQLSGHLHAGQLWPLEEICRVLDIPVLNEYERPHIKLYMTPGLGDWAIPFRTESDSAWELITLTP